MLRASLSGTSGWFTMVNSIKKTDHSPAFILLESYLDVYKSSFSIVDLPESCLKYIKIVLNLQMTYIIIAHTYE